MIYNAKICSKGSKILLEFDELESCIKKACEGSQASEKNKDSQGLQGTGSKKDFKAKSYENMCSIEKKSGPQETTQYHLKKRSIFINTSQVLCGHKSRGQRQI